MKKLIFGLVVACTTMIAVNSCDKQDLNPATAAAAKKQKPVVSHEKAPYISLSTVVSSFCGSKTPCGTTLYSTTANNQIAITNNSQTWFPTLIYTFYISNGASPNETYTPIGTLHYTCSALTSYFASGALNNGARILIFANDTSDPGPNMTTTLNYNITTGALTPYPPVAAASAYTIATMGNYKGLSCGGDHK